MVVLVAQRPAALIASSAALGNRTSRLLQRSALTPVQRRPAVCGSSLLSEVQTSLPLVLGAVEIDWSDPDVQIGALGAFLGLALGIGVPIFYISRDERDEERLEELRALNRATKAETGEYLSEVRSCKAALVYGA